MMFRHACTAGFLTLLALTAPAQDKSKWDLRKQVYYPVERNGVKILPQRFEYQLTEPENFRIGDALFTVADFKTSLREDKNDKSSYALSIAWPSAVLAVGEVHLKDSAGKTLWSQAIDPKETQTDKKKTPDGYRAWQSRTIVNHIPRPTLQRLQYYPFFQICVQRQDRETRISLCSRDLFVTAKKDGLEISDRAGLRDKSFVEINGKEVDPQGAIFLQNNTDLIFLRGLFLSGASIEIQTSPRDVQFVDLQSTANPKQFLLRAAGSAPVEGTPFRRLGPTQWEAPINVDRPTIFIKGEGGIPLKQEFIVEAPARDPKLKITIDGFPEISGQDNFEGSAGSAHWPVVLAPNVPARIEPLDGGSNVTYEKSLITWELNEIKPDIPNKRYLKISQGEQTLVGAFNIQRRRTSEARFRGTFPAGGTIGYLAHPIDSRTSWGLGIDLFGKAKSADPAMSRVLAYGTLHGYRTGEDYRPMPVEIGLGASYYAVATEKFPVVSAVIKTAFSAEFLRAIADWAQLGAEIPFAGGRSPYNIQPSVLGELYLRKGHDAGWEYGIFSHQHAFTSDTVSSTVTRAGAFAGYFLNF